MLGIHTFENEQNMMKKTLKKMTQNNLPFRGFPGYVQRGQWKCQANHGETQLTSQIFQTWGESGK